MKKTWTTLELTIVYYLCKHGIYGVVPKSNSINKEYLDWSELQNFIGHSYASIKYCQAKFYYLLGVTPSDKELDPHFQAKGYLNSQEQRKLCKKYDSLTASQLRAVIIDLINKERPHYFDVKKEVKNSGPGTQLKFDF